jgi:hypothetical protein
VSGAGFSKTSGFENVKIGGYAAHRQYRRLARQTYLATEAAIFWSRSNTARAGTVTGRLAAGPGRADYSRRLG